MNLLKESSRILHQLTDLCSSLTQDEFTSPLPILSGNTLGKHVRHIIEFYDCLAAGYAAGEINYDKRKHDLLLESSLSATNDKIKSLLKVLPNFSDKPLTLSVNYAGFSKDQPVETSFNRELVYNIEHATHHLAIIKIAIIASFEQVELPADFGIAHSTLKYQEACAQ